MSVRFTSAENTSIKFAPLKSFVFVLAFSMASECVNPQQS